MRSAFSDGHDHILGSSKFREAEVVTPTFGLGDDRHDYGRGFYMTDELIAGPRNAAVKVMNTDDYEHQSLTVDFAALM